MPLRYEETELLLRTSIEMHIQLHQKKNLIFAYFIMSLLCTESDRLVEGENMIQKGIEIANELPDEEELLRSFEGLLTANRTLQLDRVVNNNTT